MEILFITATKTEWWAFKDEIEILSTEHKCYLTSSLSEAHKILQNGIDKVVIYPFNIGYADYTINMDKDPQTFAGYYFWEQELAIKQIPTIVVDFEIQLSSFMDKIIEVDWESGLKVTFFHRYVRCVKRGGLRYEERNKQGLIKLILKNQKQGIP
jgi:hypothetical protein